MKLQQLRYIWEVARNGLNVTTTAESLYTSQPGISKQIRLLENELGVAIFARNGKQLTEITEAGRAILELTEQIMHKVESIRDIAADYRDNRTGTLTLATTHTQARYALPDVIRQFSQRYPGIALNIHQGTPEQIAAMVASGEADLAICTEAVDQGDNLIFLPCYAWNRCVLVMPDHPLAQVPRPALQDIARYPLITYTFGFTGRSQLDDAFHRANLKPRVTLTAVDADVIKTYVRLGLGVGIVAHMAYDALVDTDLLALDVTHLFAHSVTKISLRRDMFMRNYLYDFIELFAPHLTKTVIEQVRHLHTRHEISALFSRVELPMK